MNLPTVGRGLRAALPLPTTLSPGLVFLLLTLYLQGHLGLRLLEGESLRWDEAEQTLFTQRLALGYNDQPPVYTWLLWGVFQFTGASVAGVYLFKVLVLAGVYAGVYAVARRLAPDPFALPAALSLLLTPYFAWSALIDGAHTLLVSALIPLAVLAVFRVQDRPSALGFVMVGLVFGLGVLAKYSFALLAVALPVAIVTIPVYRSRLRDPRLLLTVATGLLVVILHAGWVIDHWDVVRTRPMQRGGFTADAGLDVRMWDGLGSLGTTTLLTVGPLAAVLISCFPVGCRRLLTQPARTDAVRLLGRWLVVVAGLLLLLVLLGVTKFRTHWLIPAVVLLPVYVFARLAEEPPRRGRIGFLVTVAVAVVVVFVARAGSIATEARPGGKLWAQDRMHEALAEQVATAGLERGTIVGDHPIVCANLRRRFPTARVVCVYYPAFDPTDVRDGTPIGVVWDATCYDHPPANVCYGLRARGLSDRLTAGDVTYVEVPAGLSGNGPRRLGLMRL